MKTIAQQLNIKEFPFIIEDKNGNKIYSENSVGYWVNRQYNDRGNQTYLEKSNGYWCKSEYDENDNEIYYENSNGYWIKREYDKLGQEIYYETSRGIIIDDRSKLKPEYTMKQLIEKLGEDFKLIK